MPLLLIQISFNVAITEVASFCCIVDMNCSHALMFQAASLSHSNVLDNIQLMLDHAPITLHWEPIEVYTLKLCDL